MRTLRVIALVLSLGLFAYAAYAVLYFGWVSATPLTDVQAKRVRYNHNVWLAVAIIAAVAALLLFTKGFKRWRQLR